MEKDDERPYPSLRIIAAQVDRLEAEIDAMNARLEPLRSFILPGGSALSAHLHLCRTVSRRAERLVVELATIEAINHDALRYLNRLSDWFFVAARIANNDGRAASSTTPPTSTPKTLYTVWRLTANFAANRAIDIPAFTSPRIPILVSRVTTGEASLHLAVANTKRKGGHHEAS
jgi:hypothetical protein